MVFKKFDEQQVYQVPAKHASGLELFVGDVISQNPATHEVAKVSKKSEAITALAAQKELYLIAQSDAVTEKTGTEYKNYNISRSVTLKAAEEKIIAAYRITMIDNVDGWEAEEGGV